MEGPHAFSSLPPAFRYPIKPLLFFRENYSAVAGKHIKGASSIDAPQQKPGGSDIDHHKSCRIWVSKDVARDIWLRWDNKYHSRSISQDGKGNDFIKV